MSIPLTANGTELRVGDLVAEAFLAPQDRPLYTVQEIVGVFARITNADKWYGISDLTKVNT
jgi:hypothetical protein